MGCPCMVIWVLIYVLVVWRICDMYSLGSVLGQDTNSHIESRKYLAKWSPLNVRCHSVNSNITSEVQYGNKAAFQSLDRVS
jgi:hypothetical protein